MTPSYFEPQHTTLSLGLQMTDSFADKARRKRREELRNWTVEDERAWLAAHPDDTPVLDVDAGSGADEVVDHDDDLVPDVEANERSQEDVDIDAVLDRLGIVEAYNLWANKGHVKEGTKTEGIKVRCPNPQHPDHNPSAWLNTDKDVWVCGGCGMDGGDKYDIAAWGLGFDVPGYKGKSFPELRRKMAKALGYTVSHSPLSGKTYITAPAGSEAATTPDPAPGGQPEVDGDDDATAAEGEATVTHIGPTVDEANRESMTLTTAIPWNDLLPNDSFMRHWMEATCIDDLPEEYYFWLGLTAVGLALGRDLFLQDKRPVRGNQYLVLLGRSGVGKSRAIAVLNDLLDESFPYDEDDATNTGVKLTPEPGSAEALIDMFVKVTIDDDDTVTNWPVRGLVNFDELSGLAARSARSGNPMKPTLMQFFDAYGPVSLQTRGGGLVSARDHFASVVTTTQPKAIRRLVSSEDADSGFLNRWMFVRGVEKKQLSYGAIPMDLSACIPLLRSIKSNAALRRDHPMMLSGAALTRWDDFFHDTIEPAKMRDEEAGMLIRMDLHLKKLILLFAADKRELHPSVETVDTVIALWDYIMQSYMAVGANVGMGDFEVVRSKLLTSLQEWRKPGKPGKKLNRGMTARELVRAVSSTYSSEFVMRVVKTMMEVGEIAESPHKSHTGTMTYEYVEM
jgi:hypothetical protein